MKTYYLFQINETFKKIYLHKCQYLYEILEQIYESNMKEYQTLYYFYEQLVIPIDKKTIRKSLYHKYRNILIKNNHIFEVSNIYTGENTNVFVGKTYIKIKTNVKLPDFLKNNSLDLFICDFEDKNYFWFDDAMSKVLV